MVESRQPVPFAGGLGAERLDVIAHHLIEHASGWGLRHVRGRGTTSHIPVVAKRGPETAHADSQAIPLDPLAYGRQPVRLLRTAIVADIAECATEGNTGKTGTATLRDPCAWAIPAID